MKRALVLLALAAPLAAPAQTAGAGAFRPAPSPFGTPLSAVPRAGAAGSTVAGTRHNLSVSGPGTIKSATETQVCVFCHVGHGGVELGLNRPDPGRLHAPYRSTTAKESPGQPSGASRVCLSCHDGTIAVGRTVASGTIPVLNTAPDGTLPRGRGNLGTDLSGSHPISMKQQRSAKLRTPGPMEHVKLDRDGAVQCTSCHDPHREDLDPVERKFLVASNDRSALCTSCHVFPGWAGNPSGHQISSAQANGTQALALPRRTVSENGCESCHVSHDGDPKGRLVRRRASSDQLCLDCHDRTVARTDISAQVAKRGAHTAPPGGAAVHDAAEGPTNGAARLPEVRPSDPRHVVCVDCHDPHSAFARAVAPPRAGGALAGVWGIDRSGARVEPVQYEYEVCFKCHADSANQPQARRGGGRDALVPRAVLEVNLRRVFDAAAASSHPVVSPGQNPSVPGLRTFDPARPLTVASQIFCSDCHASDDGPGAGGQGARGPHGSSYAHLLERNLSTADNTPESDSAYALCYKCHDRVALLSTQSNFTNLASPVPALHASHVSMQHAPCTACHNPHGVAASAGNPATNAHLIDFDTSIVKPGPGGAVAYVVAGPRSGSCTLTCHGRAHDASSYGAIAAAAKLPGQRRPATRLAPSPSAPPGPATPRSILPR